MKKLIVAACVAAMAVAANAGFIWSWWPGAPAENQDVAMDGCALGIGSQLKAIKGGAEVSLVYSATPELTHGAQVAVLGVCKTGTLLHGAQVGLVNFAEDAQVQVGFLCFNRYGFLPVFPFFNLSSRLFNK